MPAARSFFIVVTVASCLYTTWNFVQYISTGLFMSTLNDFQPLVYWPPGLSMNRTSSPSLAAIKEDLFLYKAFSHAMRPSKVIPFYYRASGPFEQDDITITTLVTGNRFSVFARLAQVYQGPISVAIHITDIPERRDTLLDSLHSLYISTPGMSTWVDVHLVLDKFERQFNMWRNVARFFARTDFVMLLDVDFALCTDFRSNIRQSRVVLEKLRDGRTALVIPAFEYLRQEDGMDQSTFPRNKEMLVSLARAGRIDMFHRTWEAGHNSTDYERYYAAQPGEIYKVINYQYSYEPYIIFKKEGSPWCDERFIGYGGNKAACLFEMHLSGVSFYVLPDDFLIHQSHAYEEQTRKQERKYNKKLFGDYREETCLRYLKHFLDVGLLDTAQGYNLQQECGKIKGFRRLALELIGSQLSQT